MPVQRGAGVAAAIGNPRHGHSLPTLLHEDRACCGQDVAASADHARVELRAGRHRATTLPVDDGTRSEEHTSELQSLMRISYAVFCLKKKKNTNANNNGKQS